MWSVHGISQDAAVASCSAFEHGEFGKWSAPFFDSQNWYPIPSLDVKSPMVLMAINLGLPDVFFYKAKWLSGLVRHFGFEFCVWWLFWWWTPTWCWLDLHLMVAGSIRIFIGLISHTDHWSHWFQIIYVFNMFYYWPSPSLEEPPRTVWRSCSWCSYLVLFS